MNWRKVRFIVIMTLAVAIALLAIYNESHETDAYDSFMGVEQCVFGN